MIVFLIAILVVVIGLVVAVVAGRLGSDVMQDPTRTSAFELPRGEVNPNEIERIHLDQSLRGYNMAQVDAVLDRLYDEIARLRHGQGIEGHVMSGHPMQSHVAQGHAVQSHAMQSPVTSSAYGSRGSAMRDDATQTHPSHPSHRSQRDEAPENVSDAQPQDGEMGAFESSGQPYRGAHRSDDW